MAEKVQVIVKIYEIADQGDYVIPCDMTVGEAVSLIAKIAFPTGHPALARINKFTLMDQDRQAICPFEKPVGECGFARGSKLLLI
ncbi:MAG: hypothetical protein LBT59_14130 [Clostridiales bacterium]|jgi:hypothetical protein|nr:hypothetical protein [Clostridiales bacterium]